MYLNCAIYEYTIIYNPKRTIEISKFIFCIHVWSLWSARNIMQNRNKQHNKHTCIGRYCLDTSNIPPRDASVGTHLYVAFQTLTGMWLGPPWKQTLQRHILISAEKSIHSYVVVTFIVSHIVTFKNTDDRAYAPSRRDNRVDSSRRNFFSADDDEDDDTRAQNRLSRRDNDKIR